MTTETELIKIRENQEGHNQADADYQKQTDVRLAEQQGVLNLIKEGIEHLHEKADEINGIGKETKQKVEFQNGRVRKLEDATIESKKLIEENEKLANKILVSYKVDKARVWVAISILIFLGATIITLSVMAINSKIKDGINEAVTRSK